MNTLPETPRSCWHRVQFYQDDQHLALRVAAYASEGFLHGEPVILVCTPAHHVAIEEHLTKEGFNLEELRRCRAYTAIDARDTLESFLVEGWPDQQKFEAVMADLVARAIPDPRAQFRAFGEMVALLWAAGRNAAALRVEQLWDQFARRSQFSLLCAYPVAEQRAHTDGFQAEERQLSAELSDQRYRELFNHASDGMYRMTASGRYASVNRSFVRMFGYTSATEIFAGESAAFEAVDAEERRVFLENVARFPDRWHELESQVRARNGKLHWISENCRLLPDGKLLEGFVRDVTARRDAENVKKRFLAHMSHEIRTPMNAILVMTDLVMGGELSQQQRADLGVVKTAGEALLTILNDILDLSRLENGQCQLDRKPFRLDQEVNQVLALFDGRSLSSHIANDIPELLLGDAARMGQVLLKLVGNAVKFSPSGNVRVEVSRVPSTSRQEVRLEFRVIDDGIGIPEDRRKLIFEPFVQADDSSTRRFGGAGLGLSVAAQLVSLLGGEISVESEVDVGSTFTFTACFEAAQAAGPERVTTTATGVDRQLRVLVVEDNPVNQMLARRLLGKSGHTVTVAGNGRLGLEAFSADPSFDVILMDVQMPEMDGVEATRRLRAGKIRPDVPIIAMTAHAFESDQQNCLVAGMNAVLTKPIHAEKLGRLLRDIA